MTHEVVVWAAMPPQTWIRLLRPFARKIPSRGLVELWLQHDGCCSQASEAKVEVINSDIFMTRGWGAIARVYCPEGGHGFYFEYGGASTLFLKVFDEDGRRLECCPGGGDRSCRATDYELALGLVDDSSEQQQRLLRARHERRREERATAPRTSPTASTRRR